MPNLVNIGKALNTIAKMEKGRIGDLPALPGQPSSAVIPGIGPTQIGGNSDIQRIASEYARARGINQPANNSYAQIDPEFAEYVARQYGDMANNANDPRVKASYDALIEQTNEQYEALLSNGYKPRFMGAEDPYSNSPYMALNDLHQNKELTVFKTEPGGYGSDAEFDAQNNPMLGKSDFMIDGQPALYNDLFRFVHDAMGHGPKGAGFRAMGEENAFREHSAIFTPDALPALAAETRGQNSWMNYGPHGDTNRTASLENSKFADQKAGIMNNLATYGRTPLSEGRGNGTIGQNGNAILRNSLDGALSQDGSTVNAVHHSKHQLENLDPEKYGTGLSGRTRSEVNLSYEPNWINRSFAGLETKVDPYRIENGIGGRTRNIVQLPIGQIYDLFNDPDGLGLLPAVKAARNDNERYATLTKAVRDAGYSAHYQFGPNGKTLQIYDKLDVKRTKPLFSHPVATLFGGSLAAAGLLQSEDADASFYSQAVRAVGNLSRKQGNADGFWNDLTGKGQVKPDELNAMGFKEHFGDRKDISRDEVQQFINDNQIQIKETVLGKGRGGLTEPVFRQRDDGRYDLFNERGVWDGEVETLDEAEEWAGLSDIIGDGAYDTSKFGDYTLDGGDNYRELLMSKPGKTHPDQEFKNASHFDEPNILAHLRMKDRVDSDGKKTLLIEEAQSDWHQQGAESGYKNATPPPELALISAKAAQAQNDFVSFLEKNMDWQAAEKDWDKYEQLISSGEGLRLKEIQAEAVDELMNGDVSTEYYRQLINTVPDAPFKTNDKSSWYNLAMKRGLMEAAEGDYDKMAITTGRQQADRYDLSKSINEVRLGGNEADGFTVSAFDKNNNPVIMESIDTLDALPNLIGKDAAKSLIDQPVVNVHRAGSRTPTRILAGQDLSVGGEGMKQFYDRTLPNTLNKLVKQDGQKVGTSFLPRKLQSMDGEFNYEGYTVDEVSDIKNLLAGRNDPMVNFTPEQTQRLKNLLAKEIPEGDSVHSIDITPEMRERVKKGLPLFAAGALGVGMAGEDAQASPMSKFGQLRDARKQLFDTAPMSRKVAEVFANEKSRNAIRDESELRKTKTRKWRRDNSPSPELVEASKRGMPGIGRLTPSDLRNLNQSPLTDLISAGAVSTAKEIATLAAGVWNPNKAEDMRKSKPWFKMGDQAQGMYDAGAQWMGENVAPTIGRGINAMLDYQAPLSPTQTSLREDLSYVGDQYGKTPKYFQEEIGPRLGYAAALGASVYPGAKSVKELPVNSMAPMIENGK